MEKKYIYTYSSVLSLFIVLIILLCRYFRISTDDYYYLYQVERASVQEIVSSSYFKWSGRYATFAVQNSIFKILYTRIPYFFLFPFLSFVLLIFGIYKNIQQLASFFYFKISCLLTWMLSVSFVALLFFMSFDIGETWFWCSGMACYLFSIIALTWGLFFILHPSRNLFYYTAICFCFIFIGGSCEVYAPVFLIVLICIIVYTYRKSFSFSIFIEAVLHKKLLTAFIFLTISYLLFLSAPGNYCRNQMFPEHQFFFSFFITAKSLVKFFILFLPTHLPYVLAFSTIFFVVGRELHDQKPHLFKLDFKRFSKRSCSCFILFVVFYFYMVAYIMSETGPARIWFLVSFISSVLCCIISFYAGYHLLLSFKKVMILKKLSVGFMFVILAYTIVCQYGIVREYAAAYDEREYLLSELNKHAKKDTVFVIPPLPSPGILYGAEITGDTAHHTNQHLRMWYKLRFYAITN